MKKIFFFGLLLQSFYFAVVVVVVVVLESERSLFGCNLVFSFCQDADHADKRYIIWRKRIFYKWNS